MSDESDKMCPLCAEEMDLTDRQLKPCKCGYEMCVWCWHHIMDMAEKDETEGRCPACRTPYDKERIVGMTAHCERLVAEVSIERKKSQKSKSKTSEGRKQLSSVRVVQRNLVYIIGLPLNMAHEDLLQRKEYFGQYGKVLKVSISRSSAGAIQQFLNSTCSIYITYSKEEEAVRCIQAVHGFILEGRSLRACFGTTKYCHTWLRNVSCNNPDCLYLHEIGPQEDSFTKDEIISAYTRVQQITGATNNIQKLSGSVLPPPSDDYCSDSSAVIPKLDVKNAANIPVTSSKASTQPNNSVPTGALPLASLWGTRSLNGQASGGSALSMTEPSKHKPEAASGLVPNATEVLGNAQASSLGSDLGKKFLLGEESSMVQSSKLETTEHLKHHNGANPRKDVSEGSVVSPRPASVVSAGWLQNHVAGTEVYSKEVGILSRVPLHDVHSNFWSIEKATTATTEGKVLRLSAEVSSAVVDKRINCDNSNFVHSNGFRRDNLLLTGNYVLPQQDANKFGEQSVPPVLKALRPPGHSNSLQEPNNWRSDAISGAVRNMSSELLDVSDEQMPVNPSFSSLTIVRSSPSINLANFQFSSSQQHASADVSFNHDANPPVVHGEFVSNEYTENLVSSSSLNSRLLSGARINQMGRFDGGMSTVDSNHMMDMESSIISNILSLDLDGWDESLASPQNVAKLLGEPDKQCGSYRVPGFWKAQNSNQSRFMFARQDELRTELPDAVLSHNCSGEGSMSNSFSQGFNEHREANIHSFGNGLGLHQHNTALTDNFLSSRPGISSNMSTFTRAHVPAPSFSMPSWQPPPCFSSYEWSDQIMDAESGNHSLGISFLARNAYQTSTGGNSSGHGDIEFMDPAILAVGKGRGSCSGMNNIGLDVRNLLLSSSASGNEIKVQSPVQLSASPHQNRRYADIRDGCSVQHDAYSYASRSSVARNLHLSQLPWNQPGNFVISYGHLDARSSKYAAGNDMTETQRNERLGFNRLYGGYEDPMFQMPNTGSVYNPTFGM